MKNEVWNFSDTWNMNFLKRKMQMLAIEETSGITCPCYLTYQKIVYKY